MKKKFIIILLIVFSLQLLFRIYQYKTLYLIPFNANYWQTRYENSQWSTKPACPNLDPHINPYTCVWDDNWNAKNGDNPNMVYLKKMPLGDDGVYTYAGWAYIHGHDPTTLNAEIPPFGKYLIGLSELVFHNQNIFAVLTTLLVLFSFYLLNTQLFKNKLLAFLPVFLFSFDPLFYTQLATTLMDSLYLCLLFFVFYFFFKKNFIISAIFFGLMAATKSSLSTFILVFGVSIIYLLYSRQKEIILKYIISFPIAFVAFCLTYLQYFLSGHSFRAFLGVQKWVFVFYEKGAKGSFIAPWEMIFTGKWHTWWGTYDPFYRWHIGWPILILLTIYALYIMIKSKYRKEFSLLMIWVIAYLAFLSLIPTWPRYLLLALPFLYNLSIWGLGESHIINKFPKIKKLAKKFS